ncbi:MAG: hypothetical protein KKG59_07500 [Nanoarchaeota archaeon]|nr:hypothetical protein [Nanoarchaeota archaeon]
MIDPKEFDAAVDMLYASVDRSFGKESAEGSLIKADLASRLSQGEPYLERVTIEKSTETIYQGEVMMPNPDAGDPVPVHFKYELLLPGPALDAAFALSSQSVEEKSRSARQAVTVTLSVWDKEIPDGEVKDQLLQYISGSVPYAIAFLDHQILDGGPSKGAYAIPRTVLD